jgi:hypothetical protein
MAQIMVSSFIEVCLFHGTGDGNQPDAGSNRCKLSKQVEAVIAFK